MDVPNNRGKVPDKAMEVPDKAMEVPDKAMKAPDRRGIPVVQASSPAERPRQRENV
jgi:hypothetical protein